MKKLFFILIMMIFLYGCQAPSDKIGTIPYNEEFSKAQEIIVISANTSSVIQKLVKKEELSHFIEILDIEHWKLKTLPKVAELTGTFEFAQKETIKFGECAADSKLYSVCKIHCYKEIPYITLEMAGYEMTFEVPNTTIEYLAEYSALK